MTTKSNEYKPEDEPFNTRKEQEMPDTKALFSAEFCTSKSASSTDVSANPIKQNSAFPFQSTPSGNLKVQCNQVVFQSSTIGVLIANPAQAKVKVKIQGKSDKPQNVVETYFCTTENKADPAKKFSLSKDQGKKLSNLGYTMAESVDWMRVQLPKKRDLFQEFYKRIHNHTNTDTIVHIGDEEFHCHRIVLEIYSTFFENNPKKELKIPPCQVTPEAFQTIYEWMIFSGPDSNKLLKRENVLDIFRAAKYLSIKDLEQQCWFFSVNDDVFTEDSAFAMFRQARAKGMTTIMDLMMPRISKFFLPLVASKDFLDLDGEEITYLLKSNYICVTSEIEVLMAAVRWLFVDWPSRRHLTVAVIRCVRFGLISPWQLVDIKRNPDNAEIMEIVNEAEVQQMVDDGLAYVIIKYWYGNNPKIYHHWLDVLGLTEPAQRNWIGEETNHVTYKDFLQYLEKFRVPKEQMFEQMSVMQPLRQNDKSSGSGMGCVLVQENHMQTKKMDTLESSAKDKYPNIHGFFEEREKVPAHIFRTNQSSEPQKKETKDGDNTTSTIESSSTETRMEVNNRELKRQTSVAATYLASATAALTSRRMQSTSNAARRSEVKPIDSSSPKITTPQISLFNSSKESLAKININKLSVSILGPPNKNYIAEGSLFNWDRETVLVFGGIDPHTPYGVGRNTGRDIVRFDPITNVWEYVGELPEPRHHHSVAFMKGRVYLVGGSDPRDDDIRGKSMVVSTVWSYEPVSRSWYSESGLFTPRKNFGLVVHQMALYAIGGQDKKGRVLRSVEKFDLRNGSWSEVKPMSVARMAVASTKYREYIWVAGGMTGEKKKPVCKIVECYNSKTNEWTEIHNLRFPRCFTTLFSMNDKLYLVGGAGKITKKEKTSSSVGAVDVWDWKERAWKLETEMSIPRHGHALVYLGTQLIIIGGVTTIYMRALSNVESFCCEREAWIRGVSPLPSPLSGHGAVTLPPASLM